MWNSWQGESQQSINLDGKAIAMAIADQSKPSCPKQQNIFQTDLSSTFWNLRRHRLKLFVAISCVRQSFRLRARIQVRLSWSRISRLLQLRCTTKKLDLKALLNQSYKETFKWEFGNSLVDTVNTPWCTNSRLPYQKDVNIRSAEVYMRMIQVSEAARPQFLSFRPWISGLFQQYWRNGFAV